MAEGDRDCIASAAVRKYCEAEKGDTAKSEYRVNQEAIARRNIQQLIDQSLEADLAKDEPARSPIETDDFAIKELDGKVHYKKDGELRSGLQYCNSQGANQQIAILQA